MSRMKNRVSTALSYFPIEAWSAQLSRRMFKLAIKLANRPNLLFFDLTKCLKADAVALGCLTKQVILSDSFIVMADSY